MADDRTPNAQGAMPRVSPYLTVSDGKGAIAFYEKAFGATETMRLPAQDGKRLMHAALTINGGLVMLSDEFSEMGAGPTKAPKTLGGSSVTVHLHFGGPAEVDATFKRAVDAGGEGIFQPTDMFWGDRFAQVRDPFGHVWSLGAAIPK
ncbi:MAG: VOC family protein [Alphaproteobacteria bacterium]|nr:VOC family protein [Alphaproteobacteria bacterium]